MKEIIPKKKDYFTRETIEVVMNKCLRIAMRKVPRLGANGFKKDDEADFASNREALKVQTEGFLAAIVWLSQFEPMSKVPPDGRYSSYGLKGYAEAQYGDYISNGAFIAAALHLEFPYEKHGPNAIIGVKKTPSFQAALHERFV